LTTADAQVISSSKPLLIALDLAIRRLWQHDPPRFKRLFRRWRQRVATHLQSLRTEVA
jgi:hypothetical protein